MSKAPARDRYIGIFERGQGQEALEIFVDYPFQGSGVLPPPMIEVYVDAGTKEAGYIHVRCYFAHSRQEAAKHCNVSQSAIARGIARHREIQKALGRVAREKEQGHP